MSHLLRISLPDVPGSLGAVASALGEAGVDIEAIEIVEHGADDVAIDDFFIRLPPGVMPDAAVSAVQRLDSVQVMWVSRYPTAGSFHLDLEAVELIAEAPRRAYEILIDIVPRTFRSDWAMVAVRDGREVSVVQASPGAPRLGPAVLAWFPLERAERLDAPPEWGATLLGAAPLESVDRVVLFGRHGGPAILDSELARLGHLATLAASIGQSPPRR